MPFCLPQTEADKMKQVFKSGKVNPNTLKEMSSKDRQDFLAQVVGATNAKEVNLFFERKLLLKNQERAIIDWAKTITGLNKEQKSATLKKIRDTYAEKDRRLYNPEENEQFLNELASDIYGKKYRTEITLEEAENITKLSQEIEKAKEEGKGYGAAQVAMNKYVGELKKQARDRKWISILEQEGIWDKTEAVGSNLLTVANFIAENARAMKASFDNSFFGRQGIKVLFTRPNIWAKAFTKSWSDIGKTILYGKQAGEAALDAVKAEIYERENFERYLVKSERKLDIGVTEEEFPTSFPTKIPVLGRIFKASEIAYTAGAMRMRVDLADKFYKMAEKQGIDLNDKFELGSINEMINSMTGRGRFGKADMGSRGAQAAINKVFFSVKFFKSNYDTLTLHAGSKLAPFARKQAAKNLLMITANIAIVLGIASALGADVEEDPTSADFGRIRIGNTRFDVTGGMSTLVVLANRLARQASKSSVTGLTSKFGAGYGSQTGMDAIWNFTENKFSPFFSMLKEIAEQKTFEGDKPSLETVAKGLTIPIIIENIEELDNTPNSANMLLSLIFEGLGFSVGTYSFRANWEQSTSQELQEFKSKVGEAEFKKANEEFNNKLNDYITKIRKDTKYQALSNDEQRELLDRIKGDFKEEILDPDKFYRNMVYYQISDPSPDYLDYAIEYLKNADMSQQDVIDWLYKYEQYQLDTGKLKDKYNKNHLNTMNERIQRIKERY